jgi:DJ-1 family protein
MNKKVLVPIAHGTEEMEAVIIIDMLRRSGLNVKVAGETEIITCSRGVKLIPDILIHKMEPNEEFDAIVIPGGLEGTENLNNDDRFIEILEHNFENGKIIAAICAAPTILLRHQLLSADDRVTSHPSVSNIFSEINYSEDRVVINGRIVTSRGAGTAFEFSLQLIELLCDKDTANRIGHEILIK